MIAYFAALKGIVMLLIAFYLCRSEDEYVFAAACILLFSSLDYVQHKEQ